MKLDYAIKLQERVRSNLGECFRHARHFGLVSRDMEANKHVLLGSLPADAPRWLAAFAEGYWRCLIDGAYQADLVFGGWIGETFYSIHSDRADYYEKHGISARDYADDGRVLRRGHYWKESLKPFFSV